MSIRLKTILGIAAIEAIFLCFLVWHGLTFLHDSNVEQLDKRAKVTAELFAAATKAEILSLDLATLESQVDLLARDKSVVYVRVLSANHGVLAQRGKVPEAAAGDQAGIRDAKAIIEENGVILGQIEVGISDSSITLILDAARRNALLGSGVGMLISALFSTVLGYYLTRQLSNLNRASEEIAEGNFAHRIPVHGGDELAKVARAFNHMAEELSHSYTQMEDRIRERTAELAQSNQALVREAVERKQAHRDISQILAAVSAVLIGLDAQGKVRRFNQAAEQTFARTAEEVVGQELVSLNLPWDVAKVGDAMEQCRKDRGAIKVSPLGYTKADGRPGFLLLTVSPVLSVREAAELEGMLLLLDDITDVRTLEAQLAQAQRLEAIGQLAAGIAHEINTPTQYVGDSVTFLKNAFADLQTVLDKYETMSDGTNCHTPEQYAQRMQEIRDVMEAADYDFIKEEIPKSFVMIQDGIERVRTIVMAMRRFSHQGDGEKKLVDINQALENTLTVSRNEWKYVAEIAKDLAPDLPLVPCLPGEINQVLLAIIVNAAHAIGDVVAGTERLGRISVTTRQDDKCIVISIGDTGTGIPVQARARIFDPFFTTKEVGKGTGQGLAIAYDIVVNKHGGSISFETALDQGTTFHLRLPLGLEPE